MYKEAYYINIMPMDSRYGIFYETQSRGLCRMHVINAFFGYDKISVRDFQKYIELYDDHIKKLFNVSTSSASFDLINSDQTNLVSFILKRHKLHTRYYSLNTVYGKPLDSDIEKAVFIFVYNLTHIWGVRKKDNKYYKVDSIGGVQPFNIQSLRSTRDIGLLVPVPLKYEWNKKVNYINSILDREHIKSKEDLAQYLTRLHKEREILGDLEIPLGVAISILDTNQSTPPKPEFKQITNLINKYNLFLSQFTNGQYNNLYLILKYVPDIIFELTSLQ